MDIHAGIIAAVAIGLVASFLAIRVGLASIRSGRKLTFYRLRQERVYGGWRWVGVGVLFLAAAAWLTFYGEPVAYTYFPPSPTPSLTLSPTVIPTITQTPTITLTPTITDTPSVTDTPTITPTPYLPDPIQAMFQSIVTPNPAAIFSPISFSTQFDGITAVNPQTVFQNPVGHMYGAFSYNEMTPGVQWTALWFRDGKLVHFETKPWDGTTGGYGFTDWNPSPAEWLAGTYDVQLFVGLDWKVVGEFIVQGNPPTASPTMTLKPTVTPTLTRTPSPTPTSTRTHQPTATP